MAADRLDQGDLDAALARVDVYADAITDGIFMVCRCGEALYPKEGVTDTLLRLVNIVAEHQTECPQVQR